MGRVRWIPQSLLSRSMLLIAALLVLSQLIWFGLYRTYNVRTQSEYLATQIAGVLSTVSAALETMPASARRRFSERLPSQQNIRLLPGTAWDDREVALPQSPLLRSIGEHLKRELGADTEALVLLEDATRALWIKIQVRNQAYWVVFPPESRGSASVWAWAGWSVFGLTLAIAGAYLLMLRVNRPLRALTEAAENIGAGKSPPLLDEKGPIEIRTLSRAFNRMSESLKQLDQDRALLLAGISHDLRTPLTRLRLELDINTLPATVRDAMIGDIEQMDAIVGQFLDYARAVPEQPRERVDLSELVEATLARARLDAELHVEIEPGLHIEAHATKVARALDNLFTNAARYGRDPDSGRLQLRIEARRDDKTAVVAVSDQGPGIAAGDIDRLTRPFERGDTARSGTRGAGLGLAIVARIARLHEGELRLLPNVPCGLRAELRLPAR